MKQNTRMPLFFTALILCSVVGVYLIVSPYASSHSKNWGFLKETYEVPIWEVWIWEFQMAAAFILGSWGFFTAFSNQRKLRELENPRVGL